MNPEPAAGCMKARPTVLVMERKEEQRPALNHCSSSSGTVGNECAERGELVRLHLACPKQSQQPESEEFSH